MTREVTSLTEARRFLHVNYNCHDAERLEHFYQEVFGLKTVMRSVSGPGEGPPFGLYEEIECRVTFLYDHRGGRRSCSLELINWREPAPTSGSLYPQPEGVLPAADNDKARKLYETMARELAFDPRRGGAA